MLRTWRQPLLALGELVKRANFAVNGDASKVNLIVQSDFEHKCFQVNLELVQSVLSVIGSFLTDEHALKNAKTIAGWLGLIGGPTTVIGLFAYLVRRMGKEVESVTPVPADQTTISTADSRGTVVVKFKGDGDGNTVIVSQNVYLLGEDPLIRDYAARVVSPLKRQGIDTLQFNLFARFERKRIVSALVTAASLAKIAVPKPGKEWTNPELRSAVKSLREKYDLNSGDSEGLADEIDFDLLDKLSDVALGLTPTVQQVTLATPKVYETYVGDYDPKVHAIARVEAALSALCVPAADFSSPRKVKALIKAYETGVYSRSDAARVDGVLDKDELNSLAAMGPCPEEFRNAYERTVLPTGLATPEFVELLNSVSAGGVVVVAAQLSGLRDKIRAVRSALGMEDMLIPDQITRDLSYRLSERR